MAKLWSLFKVLILAGGLVVALLCGLRWLQTSYAQGPVTLTKVLNKADNVVRVGELLSFTVSMTNNSSFTLTHVALVDQYDQTTLALAWADPASYVHDPVAGTIIWPNVAVPPIPDGETLTFTIYFTAEHPKTTVVNYARAQDLEYSGGQIAGTAETSRTQEAIGGAAPIFKSISPPGSIPVAGLPVTFTHIITNDGAALMTVLPLTDTYEPAFLAFHYAIPTPTLVTTGTLVWSDLTDYFGDLAPFQTVVVTTVFTATTQVVGTVNQASTEGALDVYDNDLTAGHAQVPITIIDQTPTATPTSTPTSVPTSTPQPANTPAPAQPTSTSAPAAQTPAPTPTVTATSTTVLLPQSGRPATGYVVLVAALLLLSVGLAIRSRKDRQRAS